MVISLSRSFVFRVAVFALLSVIAGWGISRLSGVFIASRWSFDDSWVVRVVEVTEVSTEETDDLSLHDEWITESLDIEVLFLSGEHRGTRASARVEHLRGSRLDLRPGLCYILSYNDFEDGSRIFFVSDVFRAPVFVGIFCGAVVFFCLVTGFTGIRSLAGLFLSFFILVRLLLPGLLKGYSPQILGVTAVAGVALVTIVSVVRRRRCWPSAFSGALGGCLSALLFGWVSIVLLGLSGVSTDTASILGSTLPGIDLRGILLASIIIGASGAVLDVAVSVTSAMAEMKDYNPEISVQDLFQAGLNVGKEVLGSMVNTLVFAYFGNSLVLALLILEAEPIPIAMLNDAVIAEEVIRALAGTAGLLLTIPLTALFGALMMSGDPRAASAIDGASRE